MSEEKLYHIRYNTQATGNHDKWRLVSKDAEILVSDIVVNTETKTSKDIIDGVGEKFHITCTGVLSLKDNVAYINRRRSVSVSRHIAKTITWRIIGTIDTMMLGWFVTGDLKLGLAIGGFEVITKMILYYLHERVWYKTDFGIKSEK